MEEYLKKNWKNFPTKKYPIKFGKHSNMARRGQYIQIVSRISDFEFPPYVEIDKSTMERVDLSWYNASIEMRRYVVPEWKKSYCV